MEDMITLMELKDAIAVKRKVEERVFEVAMVHMKLKDRGHHKWLLKSYNIIDRKDGSEPHLSVILWTNSEKALMERGYELDDERDSGLSEWLPIPLRMIWTPIDTWIEDVTKKIEVDNARFMALQLASMEKALEEHESYSKTRAEDLRNKIAEATASVKKFGFEDIAEMKRKDLRKL